MQSIAKQVVAVGVAAMLFISSVASLECVTCRHLAYNGDMPSDMPEDRKTMLQNRVANDPACQELGSSDPASMKQTCGADGAVLPASTQWGCGKLTAEHKPSTTDSTSDFEIDVAWRGCMPIPTAQDGNQCQSSNDHDGGKRDDGKTADSDARDKLRHMVMAQIMGISMTDLMSMTTPAMAKTTKSPMMISSTKPPMDGSMREMVDGAFCVCTGDMCNSAKGMGSTIFTLVLGLIVGYQLY